MHRMLRILVVDDEPALLRSTRKLLQVDGHAVLEAADGEAALQVIARESVDVVMTDLYMPKVDGFELIRQLRKSGKPAPQVIAVSGADWEDNPDMLAIASQLGVAATLTKPYTHQQLRFAVFQAERAAALGTGTRATA